MHLVPEQLSISSSVLNPLQLAHQTTLAPILIIWGRRRSSKSGRDWLLQSNSRHLILGTIRHVTSTTWQSRTATEQPWWRRPAAPLLGTKTPCRLRSPAQATQSRFIFTLFKVWLEPHLESSVTRCISTSDCPIVCALAFKVSHFVRKLFLVVACWR